MNKIAVLGTLLNFIVYFIMMIPILFVVFNSKAFKSKRSLFKYIGITIFIEIFLNIFFHIYSLQFFSLFTKFKGIVNYAVYAEKIIFISSSLYSIKILIPSYLYLKGKKRKVTNLVITKLATNLILAISLYFIFNTKGILFSLPITDFIYYILYLFIFNKTKL